jgi:hypothetical protein
VRIIISVSDDEQDNGNNPLPSEATGPSKRKVNFDCIVWLRCGLLMHVKSKTYVCCLLQKIPLRHQVRQLKHECDDLREKIEDLSLHIDGTHEGLEETLKEFMDKVVTS